MYTYLTITTPNNMLLIEEQLDSSIIQIGTTYQDYLTGKYILLSDDQISFKNEHKNASPEEIILMSLKEESPDQIEKKLNYRKHTKIEEIRIYDSSSEVNIFYLNQLPYWLDKTTRVGLVNSTNMEIEDGRETTTLILDDLSISISCQKVLEMLKLLEIYAKDCYNVTARHIINVNKLSSIDEVEEYDYTTNYPNKIYFEI